VQDSGKIVFFFLIIGSACLKNYNRTGSLPRCTGGYVILLQPACPDGFFIGVDKFFAFLELELK